MVRIHASRVVAAVFGLLLLAGAPGRVHAAWPPFWLDLTPHYDANRISYTLRLSVEEDVTLMDAELKLPLPAGTRLVEAKCDYPGVEASSDGKDVYFRASVVHGSLAGLHVTVEITDPQLRVFTTRAFVAWKGNPPGSYLGRDVVVDVANPAVNWRAPSSSLALGFNAVSEGDTVTYSFRPMNTGWLRMWDLIIYVPVPQDAAVTGYDVPLGFMAGSDGHTVSFSTLELPEGAWVNPSRFKITTQALAQPVVATQPWATWKNEGWGVPSRYPAQDSLKSGYLVVVPHADQLVVGGMVGNVPFDYYDLTSVAFLPQQSNLLVVFYTMGDVTTSGDTVEFGLYVDSDCRADTGSPVADNTGADFRAVYHNQYRDAGVELWDADAQDWNRIASIQGSSQTGANTVSMWIPYRLLPGQARMCWATLADSWNRKGYKPWPPSDQIESEEETRLPLPQWHSQWGSAAR